MKGRIASGTCRANNQTSAMARIVLARVICDTYSVYAKNTPPAVHEAKGHRVIRHHRFTRHSSLHTSLKSAFSPDSERFNATYLDIGHSHRLLEQVDCFARGHALGKL